MALSLLHVALAQNLPLPPLPYDYAALEPHIDESTMREHHLKHHQKYTDSLNGALAKLRADAATKHLAKMGVDTLLQHLAEIPDRRRGARCRTPAAATSTTTSSSARWRPTAAASRSRSG